MEKNKQEHICRKGIGIDEENIEKRAICIGTSELHRNTEQKMEIEEYI